MSGHYLKSHYLMFVKMRFMFELEEPVTVMEGAQMCITNQLNIF